MIEPGSRAPDFKLMDDQGNQRSNTEFLGKKVVLWFFPKADTPGCTIEGKGFRDLKAEFDIKNTEILGVSFDSVEDNHAFREKCEFPYALISDPDRQLAIACGAADDRSASHARRVTIVVGPDGKVMHSYGEVDPKTHPQQVLQDL